MSEALLIALLGLLAAPIAAFITWVANRKKNVADIYSVLTESSQAAVETMQASMERLSEELQDALEKIDLLQSEIELLRQQNAILLKENAQMHKRIDDFVKNLSMPDQNASKDATN